MNRNDVYKLIDGERDYQETVVKDKGLIHDKTVGEFLTLIRTYSTRADDLWTGLPGDITALDQIRKIAAICVSCMEQHDTPARKT